MCDDVWCGDVAITTELIECDSYVSSQSDTVTLLVNTQKYKKMIWAFPYKYFMSTPILFKILI